MMSWRPTCLCLGPGALKGLMHLGALKVLSEDGFLTDVNEYWGVSIGSIISLLMIVGYTPEEIIEIGMTFNFFEFITPIHGEINLRTVVAQLVENVGVVDTDQLREKLESLVMTKLGSVPKLYQLYQTTGKKYVSVTRNVTLGRTEYISYETEPNISCIDSAMLSIAIPGIIRRTKYRGDDYIDGYFGDPCPCDKIGQKNVLNMYIDHSYGSDPMDFLVASYTSPFRILRDQSMERSPNTVKHLRLLSPRRDGVALTATQDERREYIAAGENVASIFLRDVKSGKVVIYSNEEAPYLS